jgi:hypothetical protein
MKRLPWISVVAAILAVALMNTAGCSTEKVAGGGGGIDCVGGVIDDDGNCDPKCDPAKCVAGNVCVGNQCRLQCTTHTECWPGTQDCTPAQTDSDEDEAARNVQVCLENGRQPLLDGNGFPLGFYGQACILGGDLDCNFQHACPNGLECVAAPVAGCTCVLDEAACGDNELCNIGQCTETGQVCVFNTCDVSACTPMSCQAAGGDGDANAYCTHQDCADDNSCAAGFTCGITRDARDICGPVCNAGSCSDDQSTCSTDGDCQKGNTSFCGETLDACLDPSQFTAFAGSYFEGSICLLRRTCIKTDVCLPCSHSLDCSIGNATACAQHAGQTVCAGFCNPLGADCRGDELCLPYLGVAGATATCAGAPSVDCVDPALDCPDVADTCVPRNVCVPASGACDGSDAPSPAAPFCQHCVTDEDCGDATSSWGCRTVTQGETACSDFAFSTPCTTDADCPLSPGGRNGKCLDDSVGVPMTSTIYHTCYFPYDSQAMAFTCF